MFQLYPVAGSSNFVVFCLFAFAIGNMLLSCVAIGALERKNLIDVNRKESEYVLTYSVNT